MQIDGGTLRRLRERELWTLRELSRRADVDYTAISLMERGLRAPHPATLRRLADALGVEPSVLLRDVETGIGADASL